MTATILTYIGTLLIGVDIVSEIGHLFSLTSFGLFQSTFKIYTERKLNLVGCLLAPMAGLFAVFMVFLILVVRLPLLLNEYLNKVYAKLKDPYNSIARKGVKNALPPDVKVTNKQVNKALKDVKPRFVAMIGIVILTVGFIMEITK